MKPKSKHDGWTPQVQEELQQEIALEEARDQAWENKADSFFENHPELDYDDPRDSE